MVTFGVKRASDEYFCPSTSMEQKVIGKKWLVQHHFFSDHLPSHPSTVFAHVGYSTRCPPHCCRVKDAPPVTLDSHVFPPLSRPQLENINRFIPCSQEKPSPRLIKVGHNFFGHRLYRSSIEGKKGIQDCCSIA